MRKFSVLHLSDLHITKYRNSYSPVLVKLLESIEKETSGIKSLILVVTGDIINKSEFEKSSELAISFFKDLVDRLQGKIVKMYFTPGNHDKCRTECSKLFREYFDQKSYEDFDSNYECKEYKNNCLHYFDEYLELINKISSETNIPIIPELYYCDVIQLNDCYIRVNSINSALTSLDDFDKGSLHIGKFQIEKIEQDFENEKKKQKIKEKDIDITLTIMHHPIFWLHKDEYDAVLNNISSVDSLSTDVLLRGHTHDRNLENNYSLYNSFSTLVTGIGNDDKDKNHPQRYSIYTFMCDLNMIEIIMRSSSEKGFIPDYSAYVNKVDETRKKIHFPIKVHDYFSENHLQLYLANNDFQPIFPSKNILETMTKTSAKLMSFKESIDNCLFLYKQEFLYEIYDDDVKKYSVDFFDLENYIFKRGIIEEKSPSVMKEIKNILTRFQEIVIDSVCGFLYDICNTFTRIFFEGKLSNNEQVRVQFRVFNSKKFSHEGLTNSSIRGSEAIIPHGITPVKWGNGLIKSSYEMKKPMIYSFNDEQINDRICETEWTEYLTYAPNLPQNSYYNNSNKSAYPILTFGINSNCSNSTLLFEALSFLSLKEIIDDLIQNIHESFNFSFESLVKNE